MVDPDCDEEEIKKQIKNKLIKPTSVAKRLSYEKAKSISKKTKYKSALVIGCDTLISLNNNIYDKAKNINEARKKIRELSGKKHKIITGLTICKEGKKIWQSSVTSEVKIRKLSEKQISKYLRSTGKQILQSVGCYQIERKGPNIIEYINGDFFNVMGLPLFKLINYMLKTK
tara:strand:- start:295 stop:810 length:516 start_codon:yes stop_codon:yes gene_type:complete